MVALNWIYSVVINEGRQIMNIHEIDLCDFFCIQKVKIYKYPKSKVMFFCTSNKAIWPNDSNLDSLTQTSLIHQFA